ncbi:lamin tail domain-containing protein [Halorientalis pallida]|uniref:Endonuclease n=1 Tax=Halorientalis pallida TaxID=2479928 RepID=A0A498KX69_9EURY|nr:lamin tail domain-containing protein [Halorientalis pallida]RXK50231.1 endonuclease [Halorientalis pallida]
MDRAVVALVVLVAASGCLGLSPGGSSAPGTPQPPADADLANSYAVTVTAVVDGDTVKFRYRNGTQDTLRLLGVDTPETSGENDPTEFEGVPETAAGRDCLGEAGHDATRAMTQRLLGETVTIGVDAESDRRGYYGRLLGYVYQDGENVNYWLLTAGHARVYDSQFTEREAFDAAEQRARANGTGLWACATENPPTGTEAGDEPVAADGGTVTGPLAIADIHEDAAGDDRENLNDEYVIVENRGETALDLSEWTVSDEADHSYRFPEGTTLDPGAALTLRTGSGTDSATTLYWGQGTPVWNNDGDTVTVRAENGTVMARRGY